MLYNYDDLKRLQALSLNEKIMLSQTRIFEWYLKYKGNVCVSYSGGKDSTVLLHLVRSIYPDVKAVYVDTRLDYPEVRQHALSTENLVVLKPEQNFRQVIDNYGFCYPSKDVARHIEAARRNVPYAAPLFEGKTKDGREHKFYAQYQKWKWLIETDLKISDKCCSVMKEKPLAKYQRETGLYPYVGILASESARRRSAWYRSGCNAFRAGKSKPLSIWTEQDILKYIVDNNLKIPAVYGEIINVDGKLKCSGVNRTGCIFCPIASHLEKPNKFQRVKETHPALYKYCMKELGLDEFLNVVGVAH